MATQTDKDQMATQVVWLGDFGDKGSTMCLNPTRQGRQLKVMVQYPVNDKKTNLIISRGFLFCLHFNKIEADNISSECKCTE